MYGLKTKEEVRDGNKGLLLDFMSKHRFACLLVVNFLMALLIVTVYHTLIGNDEMFLCWIASGQFLGKPDPHLVFSNVVFGYVVSFLYRLFPSVEWYSLLLILIHAVSYAIIQDCVLRMRCQRLFKVMAFVVVCVVELKLLVRLTYTTTAGILATASLLLLWVREKQLAGVLLFVAASCVRFPPAMLAGVVFLSFYPLIVYRDKFIGKQFACLCLCVVLALGLKVIDRLVYKSNYGWEYYYQTNKARAGINDHVDIWRVYSHLPDNIIEADVRLLYGGIRDACIFDNQMLIQLHKIMEEQTSYKSIPYVKKVKYIPYFLKDYLWYWLALLPLLLLIIITKHNKLGGKYVYVPFIALISVTSFVSMDLIVKERAFLCAYVPFVLFMLFEVADWFASKKEVLWLGFLMLVCVVPLFPTSLPSCRPDADEDKEMLVSYIRENGLMPIWDYWPLDCEPFQVSKNYVESISEGWTFNMPGKTLLYRFSDLVDNENVVIVGKRDSVFDDLEASILFHYGICTEPEVVKVFGDIVIYRITRCQNEIIEENNGATRKYYLDESKGCSYDCN